MPRVNNNKFPRRATLISSGENQALLFPHGNGNEATAAAIDSPGVSRKVAKDRRGEIKATCNLRGWANREKPGFGGKQEDLLGSPANERKGRGARPIRTRRVAFIENYDL